MKAEHGNGLVILGAGNVATQLALAFHRRGIPVQQVFSRRRAQAARLAGKVKAEAVSDLRKIIPAAAFYIIAVPDDAVASVAQQLKGVKGIVLHTSGSVPMDLLRESGSAYGVLYPLQTLSKSRRPSAASLPLCIEARDKKTGQAIRALAAGITDRIYLLNSEQRRAAHLAAVFACNFTNHFYRIAGELLREQGLPFALLLPLIGETAAKVQELSPAEAQTGPALRGDKGTMKKHLALLKKHPEWAALYRRISKDIGESRK